MARIDDIARWAGVFVPPDQLTELRALGTGGEVWAGWFRGDDLRALAAAALELEPRARGIYFVPNPVRAPGVAPGRVERRGRGQTTDDDAVLARRWLLADIDPVRFGPDGRPLADNKCPATDAEREAAWQVLCRAKGALEAFGLTGAVVADSGNGWHLCYPIDLPNDDPSRQLCRTVLATLNERGGDAKAHVDVKTFNAARIWKLYGTRPRKGEESDDRRHRYSHAAIVPAHPADPAVNAAALRRAVEVWATQDRLRLATAPAPAAYARKALEAEVGKVMTASPGTRNNTLNTAAFSLGQLIAGGVLARDTVEAALLAAAATAGLTRAEAVATTRSGIEAGLKEPRTPPVRPAGPVPVAVASPPAPPAPAPPPDVGINCADLMALEIPDPRYAVPGLIPEGVTILAGRPKARKSWLAIQLALGAAQGAKVLRAIDTEPGDVLYLALEDTRRRLKKRVRKVLDATGWTAPTRLEFRTDSVRSPGGIAHIEAWLKGHPGARLVIVDTLQKFRPAQRGGQKDGYADDYEAVAAVKNMADRYAVAVLILHHSRKASAESPFDEISGTLGLTGAADAVIVMQRDHEADTAALYVTGRDVEEETLTLSWDDAGCLWAVSGREAGINRLTQDPLARASRSPRLVECSQWLMQMLARGPIKVQSARTEANARGFNASLLYRAREACQVVEFVDERGHKWWRLPDS